MKIKYNNYQFYENEALSNFLDEKKSEGYVLSKTTGSFLNILQFSLQKDDTSTNYVVLRKYFDKDIDQKIELLKQNNTKIASESSLYIIFEISKEEYEKLEIDKVKEKQSKLLSISVKKCLIYIAIESLMVFISIFFNFKLVQIGDVTINKLILAISTGLMISFSLYFIGDTYDFHNGYGTISDKRMYFTKRSNLKNNLFLLADIFKFITLIGFIVSIFIVASIKPDIITIVQLSSTLFTCVIFGGFSVIKHNNSYFKLLQLAIAFQITSASFHGIG